MNSQPKCRALSHDLNELANQFADYQHGGFVLSGEDVTDMMKAMRAMAQRSQRMEAWITDRVMKDREAAANEQRELNLVVNELCRPGSNLRAIGRHNSNLEKNSQVGVGDRNE